MPVLILLDYAYQKGNYMVNIDERLKEIKELVDDGFTLWSLFDEKVSREYGSKELHGRRKALTGI